jgi:hypothetical protein
MEISTDKIDNIALSANKDKPNNNRETTIMKGKEKNIRYDHLDMAPYEVAVTANNRRAIVVYGSTIRLTGVMVKIIK